MTSAQIKEAALKLSLEERMELAYTLWESVDTEAGTLPLHDWQAKILDERLQAAQRNPDRWLTWDEVKDRVLASLQRRPGA
jgi:putative addiction module component (TIGR02574 family)